jgi:hypothetical protein
MTTERETWEPATADDLKVGDLIRIDHRWFDHPFERRMFRISTDREIAIIREKELTRVHVERTPPLAEAVGAPTDAAAPAQATTQAAAQPEAPAAPAAPSQPGPTEGAAEAQAEAAPPEATSAATTTGTEQSPPPPDPAAAARAAALRAEQRTALDAAKARDRHTREQAELALGALSAGHEKAAATIASFVDYLVAIINNSTTPIAPMAPAAARNSRLRLALLGSDAVWLCALMGKRMGLAKPELRALTHAAAVHAAGLTRLPPHLPEEEPGRIIRGTPLGNYPTYSTMILGQCGGFDEQVVRIVAEHRERPDGSGFPRGLKGDAIHPHALILGAVRELQIRCAGNAVAPAVALAGIYKWLRETYGTPVANHLAGAVLVIPVGTYVQLSDGSLARVTGINENARLSPVVDCFGPNAELRTPEKIDLSQRTGLFIVRALDTSRLPAGMFRTVRNTSVDSRPPQPPQEILPAPPASAEPSANATESAEAPPPDPPPDQASGA